MLYGPDVHDPVQGCSKRLMIIAFIVYSNDGEDVAVSYPPNAIGLDLEQGSVCLDQGDLKGFHGTYDVMTCQVMVPRSPWLPVPIPVQ